MVCPYRTRALVLAQRSILLLTALVALSTTTVAQSPWERFGPEGGYVHRFTHISSRLFAATHAGIWARGMMGGPWREYGSLDQFIHVYAVRPAGDSLLAACETGLFISDWEGTSWRSVSPEAIEVRHLRDIVDVNDTWFVATNPGSVYRTTDHGISWVKLPPQEAGYACNTIQYHDGLLYLGSDLGAFTSDDLGETWTRISDYSTNDFAFAGEQIIRCGEVTEVSVDGGATWTRVAPNSSVTAVIDNGGSWYVGCTGVLSTYRSDDQGASWELLEGPVPLPSTTALSVFNDTLFVGKGDRGVWMSADRGATLESANRGMYGVHVLDIVSTDSTLVVGTNYRGLHFSTDHGESWVHNPSFSQVNDLDQHEGIVIKSEGTFGVFTVSISTNGGATFTRTLMDGDIHRVFANDSGLYCSTSADLFATTDRGITWRESGSGLPETVISGLVPLDTGLVLGCERLQGPEQSLFTTDLVQGVWEPLSTFFLNGSGLNEMVRSDSSIYLATNSGPIRLSTRTTMFPTHTIAGSRQCHALCARGDTLFFTSVSRDRRNWIQTSNDRGTTLSDVSGEFAEGTFTAIASDGRYLYVALGEGGLVRRPLSEVVVSVAESEPISNTDELVSVYPNPMSGTTCTIGVHASIGSYNLDVFTLDGSRVDVRSEPTDDGSQIYLPESGHGTFLIRVQETQAPYRHFMRLLQRR